MSALTRPSDLPVDQIRTLRSRGLDNNQIVQTLQRNGYTSTQIFDALNQADLSSGAPVDMPPQQGGMGMPPPPSAGYEQAGGGEDVSDAQIEEMIETIVEEKWQAVSGDISKISEWKSEMETKLIKTEQRIEELKDSFDKLHQAIIGKVGEYDKNILSVGAEIKAMERVFAKVLPAFTENVNELNRITQTLGSTTKKPLK